MYKHSVSLQETKCTGCTTCLKHCPTEAIRIRSKRAVINAERCIDCGECIRVCPNGAKTAVCDKLEDIADFKWKIALPAPALFGQFSKVNDISRIKEGLLNIGFDDVFEVSYAAEFVSAYTCEYLKKKKIKTPLISSACPAIVRLITLRFPLLGSHLLPILPPIEIAAQMAKEEALKKHPELKKEDIAVCFISPCPAKVSYSHNETEDFKSSVDFSLAINDIYFLLLSKMPKQPNEEVGLKSSMTGINWAITGGESTAVLKDKYLAADGIENAISILEEMDKGNMPKLNFIELLACPGGCVGGVLTVENPYIAKARLQAIGSELPVKEIDLSDLVLKPILNKIDFNMAETKAEVSGIGKNLAESMRMLSQIQTLCETLPGIDCGVCGAPSCRVFAEDVIKGEANIDACIVQRFEKMESEGFKGE